MKIKYNLKFTFIFIYLMQVKINLKWLGKWEETGFSKKSPPVCAEMMGLIWQFLPFFLFLFLPFQPLVVSHIKAKSNLLLSNSLNLGMVGRGSRTAAINIRMLSSLWKAGSMMVIWGKTFRSEKQQVGFRNSLSPWDRGFLFHLAKIESQKGHHAGRILIISRGLRFLPH